MFQSTISFTQKHKRDILFLVGMSALFLLYLYKIVFEIQGNDEAFYLTIPQRILQGDTFIVNEWHGSQLSALLIVPLMALRNLFCSTNDGIVLQFRYIYVLVHALCSCLIYWRIRKLGYGAVIAVLMFFMFTPFSITALSYNTMGLMAICLTLVFLGTAQKREDFAIAGFFFSAGVLCCPFLLLPFGIVFAAGAVYCLAKKTRTVFCNGLFFILGCMPLLICLFLSIFANATPVAFLNSLPKIFSDPEHPSRPFFAHIERYITSFRIYQVEIACYVFVLIGFCFDKKRASHKLLYFGAAVILVLLMLLRGIRGNLFVTYNYIMVPLSFAGLMAFFLTKKKNRKWFFFLYMGSFAYSFCMNMSSNQRFYVISDALSIASFAGIICIFDFIKEFFGESKKRMPRILCAVFVSLLLIAQFSVMGYIKVNHKFWSNAKNSQLAETIEDGPYQGIKVTAKTKENYERELLKIDTALNGCEDGTVLFFDKTTWYYLRFPQLNNGAYSAWLSGISNRSVDRLAEYYVLNPDKRPDYIYMNKSGTIDFRYFAEKILKDSYSVESTNQYHIIQKDPNK